MTTNHLLSTDTAFILGDQPGTYLSTRPVHTNEVLALAEQILHEQIQRGDAFQNPDAVKRFLTVRLGTRESEVFTVLFLDNRHRLIAFEELFQGTIDGCSVHIREIAKRTLSLNAAAIILAHNHPSGIPEPSQADRQLTTRIKDAMALLDIRVLDHLIIGGPEVVSFAERGLL